MLLEKVPTDLFIGGRWQPASSGKRFDVEDPATGERLATVADGSPEDGLAGLEAAHRAQEDWASTPPRLRSHLANSLNHLDDMAVGMGDAHQAAP